MPKLLLALPLLAAGWFSAPHTATAQAPAKLWDYRFGGTDEDEPIGVRQTRDGGYILAGNSLSGLNGDKTQASQGYLDFWLVKLDAAGTKLWDRRYGGVDPDKMYAFSPTSDGGYILGGMSMSGTSGDKTQLGQGIADYWVVRVDSMGTKLWDRRFGGSSLDLLQDVRQTSDGGYILGGISNSGSGGDRTQPSQGDADYWVVKLDANGTKQWDRAYGGTGQDYLRKLLPTSDGGYLLCGDSNSPSGSDKTQASSGSDFWVVKISATGTKQWDRIFDRLGYEVLADLVATSDGGYLLAGQIGPFLTDSDYWLVKIDALGTQLWDQRFGGSGTDRLSALLPTADGGYLLGGDSNSGVSTTKTQPSQGSADYWVVKTDAAGIKQWDKTIGGSGYDRATALAQARDGSFLLAGGSYSPPSGDKTQASQGTEDFWLVKLGAPPLSTQPAAVRPDLSAHPNPARTQLFLSGPLGTPYQLLNQLGQVVYASRLSAQPLDVQALPAGLYVLRDPTTGRTTKFVKE